MIYLVRHGQSQWNLRGRTQGQTAYPALTQRGRDEAACAARAIEADRSHRDEWSAAPLVSSDLVRARQTAEIIGARLQLPVRTDTRLRERALGALEGRAVQEAVAAVADLDFSDADLRIGGGESAREVYDRMAAVLDELPVDRTTIVVSHGDALRYALGRLTARPVQQCGWVEFLAGAVVAVEAGSAARWLHSGGPATM